MKKFLCTLLALVFALSCFAIGASAEEDTLRIAFTSEPPSLGIYDHSSLISTLMNKQMFNGLTRINNETLAVECDLAESYTVENDVEWTFKLRQNVIFHNGEKMTSADVVASLQFAKALPAASLYTASFETIEAIDEYTIKLVTNAPYANLLSDLAYYYNFIVPKSLLDAENDFNANPIGTGPYMLKEWNYGNYIELEANEQYFDAEHMPHIKNIVISIIPEGSSRSMALQAGDVDFVWEVSNADVSTLQADSSLVVETVDSIDNVILFFNNDKEPWSNQDLRNAIVSAINRDDIIAMALNGYGKPNFSCIAMGYPESTDEAAIPYDLDAAKKYLEAWGGDPASLNLTILCSNETRVAIGTVIQSNLAQIGIKVEVVPMDTASYMARWKATDFDALIASWSPADALTYIIRFHSDRRKTYGGVILDDHVDEMVLEAKGMLDAEARKGKIQEIVKYINERSPQVSLYQSLWFRAYSENLAGVVCSTTGYANFADMYWK